ncbi:hypothetical protein KQ646_12885, partial [Staphylococcus aureus]|nr:hypothetical protein [Staphylococcus aureus]
MGCLVVVKEILRLLFLLAMYELGESSTLNWTNSMRIDIVNL